MTLLVMMVQLVLAMRAQLMMMLAVFGDGYRGHWGMVLAVYVRSQYSGGLQLLLRKDLPHK